MHAYHYSLAFALLTANLAAQGPPEIEWQRCFGGSGSEEARSIRQAPDGGYIVISASNSTDGQVVGLHGDDDIWAVKTDAEGGLEWQRALGGSSGDFPKSVLIASDGGYLICGSTFSADGDVSTNQGGRDAWLIKLTNNGDIQWQRTYGGSGSDWFAALVQLANGNMVLAGETTSSDGDVSFNHGDKDMWVVELDPDGAILWETSLGGNGMDAGHFIGVTSDGGYLIQGTTSSNNGDVSGNHGAIDLWVVKLNDSGTMVWQRCLGGSGAEYEGGFALTSDDGCLVVGATTSNDGQVTGFHGGIFDGWAARLAADGSLLWQRTYGGTGNEHLEGCSLLGNDGFLLLGGTDSNDGDVTGAPSSYDYWLLRVDGTGAIIWQRLLGGSGIDIPFEMANTADGGCILAGGTGSNDGDASGNHGGFDAWVVKLGPEGTAVPELAGFGNADVAPNPASTLTLLSIKAQQAGQLRIDAIDARGCRAVNLFTGTIASGMNTIPIALDGLSGGLYLLDARTHRQRWVTSLVKE